MKVGDWFPEPACLFRASSDASLIICLHDGENNEGRRDDPYQRWFVCVLFGMLAE